MYNRTLKNWKLSGQGLLHPVPPHLPAVVVILVALIVVVARAVTIAMARVLVEAVAGVLVKAATVLHAAK